MIGAPVRVVGPRPPSRDAAARNRIDAIAKATEVVERLTRGLPTRSGQGAGCRPGRPLSGPQASTGAGGALVRSLP